MKIRFIFESAAISAVIVALMSTAIFAAYPGPDYSTVPDYGEYGSYVTAAVAGYYNIDDEGYSDETHYAYRNPGIGENAGLMHYRFWLGEMSDPGSTEEDLKENPESYYPVNYVASLVSAEFKYEDTYWPCSAFAEITAS